MVPLRLLVEQYPDFVPTSTTGSGAAYDHAKEIDVGAKRVSRQPDLVKAKVAALADAKNGWIARGASICPDQLPPMPLSLLASG